MTQRVAIVSRDPAVRLAAARAFDGAPPSWSVELHDRAPAGADAIVVGADVDEPGGVRFDPTAPGRVVDDVARTLGRRGLVVVVTATTGGAGATTVALHLAAHAAAEHETCVVDLAGGVAERLGLDPGDTRRWDAAAPDGIRLAATPLHTGFRGVLAEHDADPERADALLDAAASEFPAVVVDAPRDGRLAAALGRASAAILVTPPTLVGARRAATVLEGAERPPWALVVNRLGPGGETTIAELERVVGRRVALEIPCCAGVRDAEDDLRLVTSAWTRYGRATARLWRAVGAAR
ncbi:MAG TPA: hypothetical protein VHJ34_12620 [Actinomycetota bacterium]|nr:hypothetical protein [Actinomycetota bacterium]